MKKISLRTKNIKLTSDVFSQKIISPSMCVSWLFIMLRFARNLCSTYSINFSSFFSEFSLGSLDWGQKSIKQIERTSIDFLGFSLFFSSSEWRRISLNFFVLWKFDYVARVVILYVHESHLTTSLTSSCLHFF
jgi:hypothetical protein